jgi:hypothetical protein
MRPIPLAVLLAAAALAGCARGRPPLDPCEIDAGEGNRPYRAGTPALFECAENLVERLSAVSDEEFLTLGPHVIACGERAVPSLLKALESPDVRARGRAAYLLGVRKDRRTIPALAKAASDDPVRSVRYEAAGALLELRDPAGLDALVDGLSDPDARLRAKCVDVLAEHTSRRFGFEPDGRPEDREASIRRWRAWLSQRRLDPCAGVEPTRTEPTPAEPARHEARVGDRP